MLITDVYIIIVQVVERFSRLDITRNISQRVTVRFYFFECFTMISNNEIEESSMSLVSPSMIVRI